MDDTVYNIYHAPLIRAAAYVVKIGVAEYEELNKVLVDHNMECARRNIEQLPKDEFFSGVDSTLKYEES